MRHVGFMLLQFARLESLLQQAGRSPGRQNWTRVGDEQVRAATGVLCMMPLVVLLCLRHFWLCCFG